MTMTSKIKSEISRQLIVQVFVLKILSSIRISNLIIEINFVDSENLQVINFMFKSRNIYNLKTKFRREVLNFLTFIQMLIQELNEEQNN